MGLIIFFHNYPATSHKKLKNILQNVAGLFVFMENSFG